MCTDTIIFVNSVFCLCCKFRLQSITIHCNRRVVYKDLRVLCTLLSLQFTVCLFCLSTVVCAQLPHVTRDHLRWLKIVLSLQNDCFISMCHPWCRTRIHLSSSCLHMSVPPSSLSSLSSTSTSQVTLPINKHCDDPQNEEYGSVVKTTSSTGYEPNVIDNSDYSETLAAIFQNGSVDADTEPSFSFDAELDDELRYLHHCSLRSEKNQRTWDKLITLMKKV